METQSKLSEAEKIANKKLEKKWQNLSRNEKQKIIEKINQTTTYQWEPSFWPTVAFKTLPPVLRQLIKKYIKNKE